MRIAPIALFVYNRPVHTLKTLEALSKNELANKSILYIFSDGPKKMRDAEERQKVDAVRTVIRSKRWCKEVIIHQHEVNIGLADSIVSGVEAMLNEYEKVIVLEDDIVTSRGFLTYMNEALNFYEYNERVFHISGYMYPHWENLPNTFFYNVPLCWGWATWRRAWKYYVNDTSRLIDFFDTYGRWYDFNKLGGKVLEEQLRANDSGKLKTWFVKWHASVMMKDGFCLFPGKSLVNNIGFDGSGIHNSATTAFSHTQLASSVPVSDIPMEESPVAEKIVKMFYLRQVFQLPIQRPQRHIIRQSVLLRFVQKGIGKIIQWAFPELQMLKGSRFNHYLLQSEFENAILGNQSQLYQPYRVKDSQIGNYTYVSPNSFISEAVIGKFCSIGPNFMCGRGIHPLHGISTSPTFYSTASPNGVSFTDESKFVERKTIVIGNDVYIGANVTVLDGVTIGDGAVIGAGAVVSKDIPPYAIAVGSPIRILRYRFSEQQVEALLKIKWWNFNEEKLKGVEKYFFDIDAFIEKYTDARDLCHNSQSE